MRRSFVLMLLASAACGRSFASPDAPAPSLSGLALAGVALQDNAAIAAQEPDGSAAVLTVLGAHLGTTRDVLVGGAPAPVLQIRDDAVTFALPAPSPASVGQSEAVTVRDASGERTAGRIRPYLQPAISTMPAPVSAPGQAVILGAGFSPVGSEDQVDVAGVAATVLLAAPDRLVVQLPKETPEGPRTLTVRIAPQGASALDRELAASARPLIWEVLPPFWIDPPQVFAGAHVRFRVPLPDGGNLANTLDHALDLVVGGNLDLGLAAVGGTSGSLNDPVDGGTNAGTTSSGGTSGGGGATTGGTGSGSVDLDAGDLSANYPPDGLAAPPPPRTADLTSPDAGDAEVPAHSGLTVNRDGLDTGSRPLITLQSHLLGWQIPAETPVGPHLVALSNPAGTSQSASLAVLPGHLLAPTVSCRAEALPANLVAVPRALHLGQVQGDVLLAPATSPAPIPYVLVHPGGATEPGSFDGALLPSGLSTIVAGGRDLWYASGSSTFNTAELRAIDARPGALNGYQLPPLGPEDLGGPVLAVLEPNTASVRTWALVGTNPPALFTWSGNYVGLSPEGTAPVGCAISSGAASPQGFTLAAECPDGTAYVGRAPVPPGDGAPSVSTVYWSQLQLAGNLVPGSVRARADGRVFGRAKLAGGDAALFVSAPAPFDVLPLASSVVASGGVLSAALSPDGLQALVGRNGSLELASDVDGVGWVTAGSFPLDGAPSTLAFDAAGSQAVVAVPLTDGGSELCVVR